MKYRIVEIDNRGTDNERYFNRPSTPLTYRIALSLENNEIVLTREYFYVGYNDGEEIDGFYCDYSHITRMTYLTRNFNEKHLKDKENEIIEKFYYKLIETEQNIEFEKQDFIKKSNNKIKKYRKYQECDLFLKIKRKEKLNEINK